LPSAVGCMRSAACCCYKSSALCCLFFSFLSYVCYLLAFSS
jgi:hypothetical protein